MIHSWKDGDMTGRLRDQGGEYDEQFATETPTAGVKFRVIRDEWNLDGSVPLRIIHEVEIVDTAAAEGGCPVQRLLRASPPHGPFCMLQADHDGDHIYPEPETWYDPVIGKNAIVATNGVVAADS